MDLTNYNNLKAQLKQKKDQLSQLDSEIEALNIQLQDEKAKIEAELYEEEEKPRVQSKEIMDESEGEIIPVALPTQAAGTIVNPRLKAMQELNAAIQTSIEKKFKIINGKKHAITEEWIGPKPEGGFVNMGGVGDDYN